jgi:hypothetical protein
MPRYPTVTYGPSFGPATQWETFVVVQALQASLGLIHPEMTALAVEAQPDAVVLHACIQGSTPELTEVFQDIIGDLKAALDPITDPVVPITVRTYIGDSGPEWPGYPFRRLYMRYVGTD